VKDFDFASLTSNSSYYWKDIDRQRDGTYYDPAYVVPYILDPAACPPISRRLTGC